MRDDAQLVIGDFRKRELIQEVTAINVVISDTGVPDDAVQALEAADVEVELAEPATAAERTA